MSVTYLDDTKRLAIATKLADMKALQNLLINNEEKFIIAEYFGQLYKDLKVHDTAEEQVFYPAIRPYYEHTQGIYEQTD